MTKTALITGGAIRIGREISLYLAKNGWDIIIHCRNSIAEAEKLAEEILMIGRKTHIVQGDLIKINNNIMSDATKFNNISLLIHNASNFEKDNIKNITAESLQEHMNINLISPLLMIKEFAKQNINKNANIICLSDGMIGWSMSSKFLSYTISRQAMENAIRLIAKDIAPNIRINTLALGATIKGAMDKQNTFSKLAKITPLQKTSNINDVLYGIEYILKTNSMTGQIINIACGMGK